MEGKIALVTGSTSGIGLGISRLLAERGCSIVISGFGDEKVINSIIEDFKRYVQLSSIQSSFIGKMSIAPYKYIINTCTAWQLIHNSNNKGTPNEIQNKSTTHHVLDQYY